MRRVGPVALTRRPGPAAGTSLTEADWQVTDLDLNSKVTQDRHELLPAHYKIRVAEARAARSLGLRPRRGWALAGDSAAVSHGGPETHDGQADLVKTSESNHAWSHR